MSFNIDTFLLKSFVTSAETKSFSQAADIVGRSQAAVSLQIKKIEDGLGCKLFDRSHREISLTDQGQIFLSYAKRILDLQSEAFSRLNEPEVEGEITLGVPEDFATHYLPDILARFAQHHPQIQLHVRCDLTLNLMHGFQKNELDIILVKRDPENVKGGTKVWKEPLVWAAAKNYKIQTTIPLVLSPQPCIYRARALSALDKIRKPWQIAYTSPSLAGTIAAVKAGLGLTVLPANMLPEGITPLDKSNKLPNLVDSEIALLKKDHISPAGKVLSTHITKSLEKATYYKKI